MRNLIRVFMLFLLLMLSASTPLAWGLSQIPQENVGTIVKDQVGQRVERVEGNLTFSPNLDKGWIWLKADEKTVETTVSELIEMANLAGLEYQNLHFVGYGMSLELIEPRVVSSAYLGVGECNFDISLTDYPEDGPLQILWEEGEAWLVDVSMISEIIEEKQFPFQLICILF